jgi:hypothetical protein
MKTFFAVRICEGIGSAGACASKTADEIIANPRDATANLIFNMGSSFLCLL